MISRRKAAAWSNLVYYLYMLAGDTSAVIQHNMIYIITNYNTALNMYIIDTTHLLSNNIFKVRVNIIIYKQNFVSFSTN